MTDPYNSYQTHVPVAPPASPAPPTRPPRDEISRLDVSDAWKARFRTIERAGGPDLPNFRDLPGSERRGIHFNWVAFLLGPFYYLAKGLWRQAIAYTLFAFACVLVMETVGLGRFGQAVGYGIAALYAIRANISYYKRIVLGETPWV